MIYTRFCRQFQAKLFFYFSYRPLATIPLDAAIVLSISVQTKAKIIKVPIFPLLSTKDFWDTEKNM